METTRRQFMVGCSTAIASMAGGRVGNLIFADEAAAAANTEIMVVVFLRGGCDGLSLVTPYDDPAYVSARGRIAVPGSGPNAALRLTPNNTTVRRGMGLHPKASALKELYDGGKLAIVHACGLDNDTRSHFEAMDFIERGTPGVKSTQTGWITRHLQTAHISTALPALAPGPSLPVSLLGDPNAVSMTNAKEFDLSAPWVYNNPKLPYNMLGTLKQMYGGNGLIPTTGKRTINVIETLRSHDLSYTPASGSIYPDGSFGSSLKLVAQTIKLDLGLQVSTVDFGGWDTHENQGDAGGGYFAAQVDQLSRGLQAFFNDLSAYSNRLTVVVLSEFGRRMGVNSSGGTDHGHGNVMFVLGGNVNGGRIFGQWPGLVDLDQDQDLRITTDYRTVLSEVLIRRLANPQLGTIFPGFTAYKPLGIVKGADIPPVFTTKTV